MGDLGDGVGEWRALAVMEPVDAEVAPLLRERGRRMDLRDRKGCDPLAEPEVMEGVRRVQVHDAPEQARWLRAARV